MSMNFFETLFQLSSSTANFLPLLPISNLNLVFVINSVKHFFSSESLPSLIPKPFLYFSHIS